MTFITVDVSHHNINGSLTNLGKKHLSNFYSVSEVFKGRLSWRYKEQENIFLCYVYSLSFSFTALEGLWEQGSYPFYLPMKPRWQTCLIQMLNKQGKEGKKEVNLSVTNRYGRIWERNKSPFVCSCLQYLHHLAVSTEKLDLILNHEKNLNDNAQGPIKLKLILFLRHRVLHDAEIRAKAKMYALWVFFNTNIGWKV